MKKVWFQNVWEFAVADEIMVSIAPWIVSLIPDTVLNTFLLLNPIIVGALLLFPFTAREKTEYRFSKWRLCGFQALISYYYVGPCRLPLGLCAVTGSLHPQGFVTQVREEMGRRELVTSACGLITPDQGLRGRRTGPMGDINGSNLSSNTTVDVSMMANLEVHTPSAPGVAMGKIYRSIQESQNLSFLSGKIIRF